LYNTGFGGRQATWIDTLDHIADALSDVIVTEEIAQATPFWAVLAMGLAGRLAADFGAHVVRPRHNADPLWNGNAASAPHLRALRSFLCHGKDEGVGSLNWEIFGGTMVGVATGGLIGWGLSYAFCEEPPPPPPPPAPVRTPPPPPPTERRGG